MVGIKNNPQNVLYICLHKSKIPDLDAWKKKTESIFFVSSKNSCGCGSSYIVINVWFWCYEGFRGCLPLVLSDLKCLKFGVMYAIMSVALEILVLMFCTE